MAAVDPNVYALNIQLQLDAQEAFSTLDKFETSITSLEENLTSAAEKALKSIDKIVSKITTSYSDISSHIDKMDMGTNSITKNLQKVNDNSSDSIATTEGELKLLLERREILNEVIDQYDEITKTLNDHLEMHTEDVDTLGKIYDAIVTKNIGHADQNDLIDTSNKGLHEGNELIKRQRKEVHSVATAWRIATGQVSALIAFLKKVDEGTEAFVQTNYRAYGSQQLLLQSTRTLTAELGVSSEIAIQTYKALADLRIPRDELGKYAKIVAMANRTTGANVETITLYAAKLKALGLTAGPLQQHVAKLTEQMRKFGLTSDDVNRSMQNTANNQTQLRYLFGENAEELQKFELANAAMLGVARDAKLSTTAITDMQNKMSNPESWLVLGGFLGTEINNVDQYKAAMLKLGAEFTDVQAQMNAASDTYTKTALGEYMSKVSAEILGNADAGQVLIEMYKRASKESGKAASSAADYDKVMKTLSVSQENQYTESMNSLYKELENLRNIFGALYGSVASFVADGMKYFIRAINAVLIPISTFITKVMQFIEELEQSNPILGNFITVIKIMAAGLVAVGAILFTVVSGFSIFRIAIGSLSNIFTAVSGTITSLANSIVSVATAIGKSIFVILRGLGQGLAALGQSVRPVIVPLLALGAALLLVSISSWIFAQSVATIASVGDGAITILLGMVVALSIMGAALVGLGMLAQGPVAIGVLVVAAALLAAGAAAVMMGYGVKLAADGLAIIAAIVSADLILKLPLFAAGILYLGVASATAAIGLILLTASLVAMTAALVVMLPIMLALIPLIAFIPILVSLATSFMTATIPFSVAASLLASAASQIVVAAFTLIAGATTLIAVSALLLTASITMSAAGLAMLPASLMVYAGLSALDLAISRFSKTIGQVNLVGAGLMNLATAFNMLKNIQSSKLKDVATDTLNALPSIDKLSIGINKASSDLAAATSRFTKPADRLTTILNNLGSAMSQFGEAVTLSEDVGKLATMLDDYTKLLEGASERIETAIQTKAVPAMKAAEEAGIKQAVKSEAITTVKVMSDREGDAADKDLVSIGNAQLAAIQSLVSTVEGLQIDKSEPMRQIITLLQTFLPALARKDTGLSTEFNAWAR